MKQPLRIGLTGGIGSGKSTVAKVFEVFSIPVLYADDVGKKLMNSDPHLRKHLVEAFGEKTYVNDRLDRKYLSSLVFGNREKLERLNALVHPATIAAAERWFQTQTAAYVIKEAALLFESGSAADLDFIIGVSAPQNLRILRTMQRDDITREKVLDRIDKQIDESIKMKLCDFVIVNDEQQMLLPQILHLHKQLLQLAEEKNSSRTLN